MWGGGGVGVVNLEKTTFKKHSLIRVKHVSITFVSKLSNSISLLELSKTELKLPTSSSFCSFHLLKCLFKYLH